MTTVITRFFDDATQARLAKSELVKRQRFSVRIVDLYDDPATLADSLAKQSVDSDTIQAYEARMANGGAVLLVRAGFKPLGVAQTTRDIARDMGAADMAALEEEVYVEDPPARGLSVLDDQPLMLTRMRDPDSTDYHMADWPIPLISRRKPPSNSVTPPNTYMTEFAFPLLLEREPYTKSIFPRHARMANFPIPLLSKRKPFTGSIFPRHARMANFPIPLISRRKPSNRSIFPRHQRMATVPFPLLINGKTGTNSLIPGGPRMANFPIPLTNRRKPNTASVIPRHARMANFPIPLISRRKPATPSIIPRHARMANFPLPLLIKRTNEAAPDGGSGFSFSKMLGMKTISRR